MPRMEVVLVNYLVGSPPGEGTAGKGGHTDTPYARVSDARCALVRQLASEKGLRVEGRGRSS